MFERKARDQFFVIFKCAFERCCSNDFLVIEMSDTNDASDTLEILVIT